jgi:hypothetical protein
LTIIAENSSASIRSLTGVDRVQGENTISRSEWSFITTPFELESVKKNSSEPMRLRSLVRTREPVTQKVTVPVAIRAIDVQRRVNVTVSDIISPFCITMPDIEIMQAEKLSRAYQFLLIIRPNIGTPNIVCTTGLPKGSCPV